MRLWWVGLRGKGAVVVVLQRRCFFSELRVITLKTKNKFYSKNYYYYRLPHTQSSSSRSPRRRGRSIFFSAPYYIQTNPLKKPHPHRWRVSPLNHSLFKDPPKAGSPLPLSPPCIPPKPVLHGLSAKSKFLAVLGGRALKPLLDRSRVKRLEALSPEVAGWGSPISVQSA